MTSRLGAGGSALVLLAVPLALLSSLVSGDAETALHLLLGAGFVVVSRSLFDFGTSRWVSWVGVVGIGGFGAIFLVQGVSDLARSEPLHRFAYDILGQELERVAPDLFFFWCAWTVWRSVEGSSRLFGACVVALVAMVEVYDYVLTFSGGDAPGILKLLYLLPFAWLLVESLERRLERPTNAV